MRWSAAACVALALSGTGAAAQPVFVERAAALGIDHHYTGDWEHFVGGGVAVFDCDGDDLPDLFVAGGTSPAALLRNRSTAGELTFLQDTPHSLAIAGVTGAYPLDVDSDGQLDLAVLRVGGNLLLRGGPNCSFAPFELGFQSADRWTTAFSATWEAGRDLPTLAFGNYVDRADPEGPFEACDANALYRPEGSTYGAPQMLEPGFCALSMLFSDWGRTGRPDLRVSNDRHYYVRGGGEQLWAMAPLPRLYGAEDGWRDAQIWGMGIASRDISGDGRPEIVLTSMGDQKLHSLTPDAEGPSYVDAPFDRGISAHRPYLGADGRPSTGWHAEFGDVDNDGRDDLFIAKGNVDLMPSNALEDPNNLLLQGPDGRFSEAGGQAGVGSVARARGASLTDLDLDGRLDLVVVNRHAPLEIYRNETADTGGWLAVDVRHVGVNSRAIGAWLELRTGDAVQSRELTVGGGHAGGKAGPQHFGLGQASAAELRAVWPDGAVSPWFAVAPDSRVRLSRSADGATRLGVIAD